ncbi:hypothetical protein TVAG_372300 [Trichomonas vaginalis G3]|uniref:Surface antigen BspA-like n=1 Tax=Trichomonas vaginalis (strain ATCC PRA-98 / G3) TaxID=412133 RepID=A2FZZ6_TRIV3|nr:leucine-rich repeats (6 copies)-containing protein [Trichomonas vaginalis G3]EAX89518.1 hypothetical protein TVAG_372300 [Trichomonas vaginalis G3]KAI5493349.1 leucine-rich repeats (6 copies)-containing protein [Trichomonas vaginalis G3]|eukprot:XP_001302448.1 hypothetical protein [Trichomonas vaginalis G3]
MDIKTNVSIQIGARAFYNCSNLIKVKFPDYYVFLLGYCFAYTGIIAIPKIVIFDETGPGIFSHARNLIYINMSFGTYVSGTIPPYAFEYTSLYSINCPNIYRIYDYAFSHIDNLFYFVIPAGCQYISGNVFYLSENVKFFLNQCKRPNFIIGEHELVAAKTKRLILTYGKLPSTYVIPSFVSQVGKSSIHSYPKYSEDGKVIDYGVTTLVVPRGVIFIDYDSDTYYNPQVTFYDDSERYNNMLLYLQNICYGNDFQSVDINAPLLKNIYVTNTYQSSFWYQNDKRIPVIKGECDSSTSFEDLAKGNYYAPTKKSTEEGQLVKSKIIDNTRCPVDVPIPDLPSFIFSDDDEIPDDSDINSENLTNTTTVTFSIEDGEPNESSGLSSMIIILIAATIVEVIIILALIIMIIIKQKAPEDSESTFEFNQEQIDDILMSNAVTVTPALFNTKTTDDPFAEDFADSDDDNDRFYHTPEENSDSIDSY